MKNAFWFFVLCITVLSLLGLIWGSILGYVQLPWYGTVGAITVHIIIMLFGVMETSEKAKADENRPTGES